MTSTSFNVGVDIEAKNSSRVLRPPGGGHTDIFGTKEPTVPMARKDDRRNVSSILEGTNQEKPSDVLNGNNVTHTKHEEQKESPKEQTTVPVGQDAAPKRGRVPPGGFSSGLW
ncbi:hypothetical protein WA026_018539 [Henosepilachna vigintioctopunctata]|uniref:Microtubule-associated protein Jupiter n=1 Tax=Henosepilachna vigintioctopunctata TaxID=420089 RepID=A0AAW1UBX9_9CUCU